MTQPGQSWPFRPSATAQADYWNLDFINQRLTEDEKEVLKKKLAQQRIRQPVKPRGTVKHLESDIFSVGGVRTLEKDYWGKNKKKSKSLNKTEKILKRIL